MIKCKTVYTIMKYLKWTKIITIKIERKLDEVLARRPTVKVFIAVISGKRLSNFLLAAIVVAVVIVFLPSFSPAQTYMHDGGENNNRKLHPRDPDLILRVKGEQFYGECWAEGNLKVEQWNLWLWEMIKKLLFSWAIKCWCQNLNLNVLNK